MRIVMKKIDFLLVLVIALSLNVFSQNKDGFFNDYNDDPYNRMSSPTELGLSLPSNSLGSTYSETVPIGDGIFILTLIGMGYAIRKRVNQLVS